MSGTRLLLFFIMMSLGGCSSLAAKLHFDSWTTRDGLPQNSVLATTKTRDGYLWVGTFEGLSRFDGVSFTTFNNVNTHIFRSNFVKALLEDRSGVLWIGIDGGGLVRRIDGQFKPVTTEEGFVLRNVVRLFETSSGAIAVGSDDEGMSYFADGKFSDFNVSNGLPSNFVTGFANDGSGGLWISTRKGLVRLQNGVITRADVPPELLSADIRAMAQTHKGELWIGKMDGLSVIRDGRVLPITFPIEEVNPRISTLLSGTDGEIWIGTHKFGLWRMTPGAATPEHVFDAPGTNRMASLMLDREGSLWAGSVQGGLHRYRARRFRVYTKSDGLAGENPNSIFQRADGTILIANDGGLDTLRNNRFEPFLEGNVRVSAFAEDPSGNLWLGMSDRVRRISRDGTVLDLTPNDGLRALPLAVLLARRDGSVMIGTSEGLWEFRDGKIREFSQREGLPHPYVIALFEDRSGNAWVGTRSGLGRLTDGRFESWSTADGLGSDHILSFHEDGDGTLWIGTSGGGLVRFRDGRFDTVNSSRGLYDNLSFVILEDSRRNLWFCGNRGIYRTAIDEVNAVADGSAVTLSSFSYDTDDGLLNRECNGGNPAGFRAQDGRLWFPTAQGVAVIDPTGSNSNAPTVIIESVTLGGVAKTADELLEINPNEGNLEIKYTGISWDRPTKIRFRYKLEGLSDEWNDVGERRTAYFSFLPPGDYRFQVIADNGEGVWNPVGQTLQIRVYPPFYRAWWFSIVVAVFILAIAFWLYRWRIGQLQRARLQQQEFARKLISSQEQERKRIAAELHDSLGQRLVIIKNLALMFLNGRSETIEELDQINEISTEASNAISEVKTISYNLRPYQLDRMGLTKAVKAVVKSAETGSEIEFASEIDELEGFFPKESEINFYRVVQEILTNVVKHSGAGHCFVTIKRSGAILELEIADDGIGFIPGQTTSKTGGFGLQGMTERVELLGGTIEIHSTPNQGTTVRVRLRQSLTS